jgi:large subunit ribosomal protein L21
MYAVIEVGAKQFCVKKDDVIEVEKMPFHQGKDLILGNVLLLSKDKKVEIGQPFLKDVKVHASVLQEEKGPKEVTFKYRRRKAKHRSAGHRQKLLRLKIKDISSTDERR